ncbi:MAG TPA: apolipoprotein N-acyltransferase [Terriglobales bacterium]|nr:apolipoprotein N-acyltransferase [Terriglobales bacterium]
MQTTREKNELKSVNGTTAVPSSVAASANSRSWIPWLLAVISGALQIAVFPLPDFSFLCWIALAPLLVALVRAGIAREGQSRSAFKRGFLLGLASGVVYYAGSCYWVFEVMHNYGGISGFVAVLIMIAFCLAAGSAEALFAGLLSLVASRKSWGTKALVAAPFFWVAMEFVYRLKIWSFPWDLLGTALVNNFALSRIATVTGTFGLSFEIMLVNAAFASAFLGPRRRRSLVLAGTIFLCGILETGRYFEPPPASMLGTARLVQQNLPLDQPWTQQSFETTLAELAKLSVVQPNELMPGEPLPDLIVWPESPAPFFETDARVHQALSFIAEQAHAYVLAGTLGVPHGHDSGMIYNSAQVVAPNGDWLGRYDKIHLVPFGEYVPLKGLFDLVHLKRLVKEVGNFLPGEERIVLPVHSYKLGTFICYESTYPDEVREFAANGATLLVNISNDGWFGDNPAPFQSLRMARMRAIENDRWILRSTNTGITASIDPFGRIVQQARRNVRVAVNVPYGVVTRTTFYTRHGDWFAWMCTMVCAIITIGAVFSRKIQPVRA